MKKRVFKIAFRFIAGFIIFFLFRLVYSYSERTYRDDEDGVFDFFESESVSRKNYASDYYKFKNEKYQSGGSQGAELSVSQKYEKVATLATKSEKFEQTEKSVRAEIRNFNCVVQYEQKSGNKGNRSLSLMLGVKPEKFDSLYEKLKQYGNIRKAEITKIDKTSEFKALNARRISLEKSRDALIALKNQNGKIEEFISLEERILSIQDTLQFLGVSLGDFDLENEFCTIKYTLSEGRPPVSMSLLHRLKVSLEWAIEFYFFFILVLIMIFICSFILLFVIDRFKVIQFILRQNNNPGN
jgi:phage anti-repressor protein